MANHGGGNPEDIEQQSPDDAVENPGSGRSHWFIVKVVVRPFVDIFIITYTIGCIFIGRGTSDQYTDEEDHKHNRTGIQTKKPTIKVKTHQMCFVAAVRVGCLVLIWMAINVGVPSMRRISFLGSLLWKWSLLVAVALIAHPLLTLLCDRVSLIIVEVFSSRFRESNVKYFIEGAAHCLIWVMYITSLLLTWLLCVDTTIAPLHKYGMLTLVSFLVGTVLNVVKSLVVLFWKTKLIYSKYKGKILSAGCQLYFHLLIMDKNPPSRGTLVNWWILERYKKKHAGIANYSWRYLPPIEEYLLMQGASLGDVHEVATCLSNNFELSLTLNGGIPNMDIILRGMFSSSSSFSIENAVHGDENDAQLLRELLQADQTSESTPAYDGYKNWMVQGLGNFLIVGYRIRAAYEVMNILNRVLTAFIVIVVILIWLFITGFATTKVVVGLASVFLGLTFVFGDACKTFFQGVIFTFVTHPFDVTDRCIIDNEELRVRKINILTTTFYGGPMKETVLYPNSYLATKHIILLHDEEQEPNPEPELTPSPPPEPPADLTELIDFSLPSRTTSPQIESLQENIERYLEDGFQCGRYKMSHRVTLMEVGENIRMRVYFEHDISSGDNCRHLESVEIRKEKQRSEFLLQLKKFLENIGDEVSPS